MPNIRQYKHLKTSDKTIRCQIDITLAKCYYYKEQVRIRAVLNKHVNRMI